MFEKARMRRALRQARKGIAMVDALMESLHLDRAARRRLWHDIHTGKASPADFIGRG